MGVRAGHVKYIVSSNENFTSRISDLTNACDCLDNLHILIYLIKEEKFIYNNASLGKIVGGHCDKLLVEGWDYLFSLVNKDELEYVRSGIRDFFSTPCLQDPLVLKYHIINERGVKVFLRHEILLHCLENQMLAINYFFDITEKEKIEKYLHIAHNNSTYHSENRIALISPREKEVLNLVADGFSSKQIAEILFISNHTAISHRKNLIEKFHVKNTAQLIKRASRTIGLW